MPCYSYIIYLYREIESLGNKEDEYTVRIYACLTYIMLYTYAYFMHLHFVFSCLVL